MAMRLATYLPDLTGNELNRYWLNPAKVCDLAVIGQHKDSTVRRFLANVSDRDLVPFRKSGAGKTAPRLYSLKSATMLRAMKEITSSGRSYEFAAVIADEVGKIMDNVVETEPHYDNVSEHDWLIVYSTYWNGRIERLQTVREVDFNAAVLPAYDNGIFAAGSVIWNILRTYADVWANDRIDRRLDVDQSRYVGNDAEGRPLDPNHPWNQSADPVERAKLLLRNELIIGKRVG